MPLYTKPYLSLADQLHLIQARGLEVADDTNALVCLHRNGYYRLSAYWYPFRQIVSGQRTDTFLPGSRFEDAMALYVFDKKLKLLLLDALERVEIAARVEISLLLGQRDPFAHERSHSFHPRFTTRPPGIGKSGYDRWRDKFNLRVMQSRDEFVLHYESQYGSRSPLPLWIAIELWDFGLLANAFSGMRQPDQAAVAARFSLPDWRLMESWLRSLNYVRNVIAHHGRLWNLNISVIPRLPRPGQITEFDALLPLGNVQTRVYSICCILCYLSRVVNPQSSWVSELKSFLSTFPAMPHARIHDMGFPADWQTHGFWT